MSEWPPFLVTFTANGSTDAVRALRRVLKFALRECGLRAVDAHPIFEATSPSLPAQLARYNGGREHARGGAALSSLETFTVRPRAQFSARHDPFGGCADPAAARLVARPLCEGEASGRKNQR